MNTDQHEINKFSSLANSWWDAVGELRTLHHINPIRVDFIKTHIGGSLHGMRILDVGCGGGILSEALAKEGASVTGIDASADSLGVAKLHMLQSGIQVDYVESTAEAFAQQHAGEFDVITCLEMLEHVPDSASVIRACAHLVKPGGELFFSTLSRTPKAYLFAVLGAEYILSLIPKGTHDYAKFIKPHELSYDLRQAGLQCETMQGLHYNPFTHATALNSDLSVNYLVYATRNAD